MNKKAKKPISQRICESLDIPVGTFGRCSSTEAVGNREVSLCGCERLVSYTDVRVILKLCDNTVSICGEGLTMRSFSGGRISVCGRIDSICYGEARDDK
ncbi:MAG: YabP/YqfC family sporulation protein [Clostridia bacterium]|nr:YabP/YqfC family sporulation protein [Clostridia bacterium]